MCDIGTAQCEDETVKYKKKSKRTTECDKRTVTCDVRTAKCEDETVKYEKKKKVRKPLNVTKKLSHVRMELSNVKKSKGTTQCDKRIHM